MRPISRRWLLLLALPLFQPTRALAQLPLLAAGFAGGAFNTDDNGPDEGSGGFAFQADLGLRLSRVSFGAELAHHKTSGALKTKVYGGFLRLPSLVGDGPVQVYFVAGLGNYRFAPSGGGESSTLGGSLGPGVSIRLQHTPIALDLEARFHSTFEQLPRINSQQFLSLLGGLELRF